MKFTEILEELKKGEKVTREKWKKPSCTIDFIIYDQNKGKFMLCYNGNCHSFAFLAFLDEDIIAEDWKIYEEPNKNWQPEEGETYFFVSSHCSVDNTTYNSTSRIDSETVSFGNCFRTEEEARKILEKLKIINKLRELSNGDFYRNCTEVKYVIWYDSACKEIKINTHEYIRELPFSIYFATKKDAEKAVLTIGEDNLKKYYFDVEEEE